MTMSKAAGRPNWLAVIRRYLLASAAGHLAWETAQLPLYTLWRTGSARDIAQALLHCALGDLSIAIVVLVIALATAGAAAWPEQLWGVVMLTVLIMGTGYTVYSEYMNTVVWQRWSYAASMPTLPWLGTGLSPLAQWMVVSGVALAWAGRGRPGRQGL
jgi:hypothetical protein